MKKMFGWLLVLLLCPIGFETVVRLVEGGV